MTRVLPYWPQSRYLELAPNNWARNRAKLLPAEFDAPFVLLYCADPFSRTVHALAAGLSEQVQRAAR